MLKGIGDVLSSQRCPVDGTSGSFLFVGAILLVFGAGDIEKCQTGVQ